MEDLLCCFAFFQLIILGSAEKRSLKDVCPEVSEEEAHCGHSPAGTHLLREENHVEGTMPLYCKVSKYCSYDTDSCPSSKPT